jgi:hypothetical protein
MLKVGFGVKVGFMHYKLVSTVHDCSEKIEAYWAKKSQKFKMPELAETVGLSLLNSKQLLITSTE